MQARLLLRCSALLALGALFGGCGKGAMTESGAYRGAITLAPAREGAVSVVTSNTTRLGGAEAAADAAAVALAVYPGLTRATRPAAVVLVDQGDWPAALAASALAGAPLGAPLLYAEGDRLPNATAQALRVLRPLGAPSLGGAQVIRVGTDAAVPEGLKTLDAGPVTTPERAAAAVELLLVRARRGAPGQVLVLDSETPPSLQMPAAGLAAESGAPILFVTSRAIPAATAELLRRLHRPRIYALGSTSIGAAVLGGLARLGPLRRVSGGGGSGSGEGSAAVENAIAVARYADGSFGWGVHEAGHGLVFANTARPLDGPAAALLSAHGDYAPLLLLESASSLPPALAHYLSDIQPGYSSSIPAVRGVYNRGWLIGDERAISAIVQSELDAALEIAPREATAEEATVPTGEEATVPTGE